MRIDPFDLTSIFLLRELIDSVDPHAGPTLRCLVPAKACRSIAILPGSFNPPTAAHVLLAERANAEGFDCVLFTLSRTIAGKRPHGLTAEDRLLTMRAAGGDSFAVGVCSHGLYADQAEAASALFPGAEVSFLLGSDKVLQIFEDRWYADRNAALERLFASARLIVAPRGNQSERLREVLGAPGNRGWADRVDVLQLHPAVSDLSSTRVRGLLGAGADPNGLVPPSVAELLIAMRAFSPPVVIGSEEIDAYQVRSRLIDLVWSSRRADPNRIDLRALVGIATAPGEPGRKLRAIVRDGSIDVDEIQRVAAGA